MKTLVDRLNDAYEKAGFESYAALARAAGLKSRSTISDLFRGHIGDDSPALVSLALAMNVNPIWLQRGKGPMAGPPAISMDALTGPDAARVKTEVEDQMLAQMAQILQLYSEATPAGRKQILRAATTCEKKVLSQTPDLGVVDNKP